MLRHRFSIFGVHIFKNLWAYLFVSSETRFSHSRSQHDICARGYSPIVESPSLVVVEAIFNHKLKIVHVFPRRGVVIVGDPLPNEREIHGALDHFKVARRKSFIHRLQKNTRVGAVGIGHLGVQVQQRFLELCLFSDFSV